MPNEPTIESVQAANREYARRIKELEEQVSKLEKDRADLRVTMEQAAFAMSACADALNDGLAA